MRRIVALVCLAVILPAANEAVAQQQQQPAGDAARGHDLFETCMGCHGIEGYRNAYPSFRVPKLGGQHEQYIIAALNGYDDMSARSHPTMFAQATTLSAQDKADVAAYLASLGDPHTEGSPGGGAQVERGKAKAATCTACHGANGVGQSPVWPTLAGQHQSYLVHALTQYKDGERTNPVMAGLVAALSQQDIEDLAAYFAAQPGLFTPPRQE